MRASMPVKLSIRAISPCSPSLGRPSAGPMGAINRETKCDVRRLLATQHGRPAVPHKNLSDPKSWIFARNRACTKFHLPLHDPGARNQTCEIVDDFTG